MIDIGYSEASVIPVVDGFVLRKGDALRLYSKQFADSTFFVQGRAHDSLPKYVRQRAKHALTNPTQSRQAIQLYPHQLIAEKKA